MIARNIRAFTLRVADEKRKEKIRSNKKTTNSIPIPNAGWMVFLNDSHSIERNFRINSHFRANNFRKRSSNIDFMRFMNDFSSKLVSTTEIIAFFGEPLE